MYNYFKNGEISKMDETTLKELKNIDAQFEKMSDDSERDNWVPEALGNDEWEEIRYLAKRIVEINSFGD